MSKFINTEILKVLEYIKGKILNNNQIKLIYSSNAGYSDFLFENNNIIFLIYIKWDRGTMSENNINLFLKACSYITTNPVNAGKLFYGIIISKKPTKPITIDRLINIHLDNIEISDDFQLKEIQSKLYSYLSNILIPFNLNINDQSPSSNDMNMS
jgi:hypothetical protein